VALVITLLLLFLLSVIGLAAVLSASSDLLINGYYNNYRGSFYAADSGLNIARQTLQSALNPGTVPWDPTWTSCTVGTSLGPLSAAAGVAAQQQVLNIYGNATSLAGAGSANPGPAASSWSENFKITNASVTLPGSSPTVTCPSGSPTAFQYIYNYSLTAVGSATGSEQSTITENGSLTIYIAVSLPLSTKFSYFGAFVDNYPPCLGPLVPGTMTGPMFTNGAWGFMPGGSYIFTDPVGQADPTASYWDSSWNCYQSPNSSFTAPNGQTIAPQFQGGFQVGQPPIAQPANDFSQKWATLDGVGCGENNGNSCADPTTPPPLQPTSAQMNAVLRDVNQNAYPTSGAASGVYLSYQSLNGTPTMAGGGFYVEGNAQIGLATTGASGQVVTITQGATVTTITIDPVANTTVVTSGGTTLTLAGVPADCSTVNTPPNPLATPPTYCTSIPSITHGSTPGTMLYVDGTITAMSGPGEGVPAIQDGAAITIAALSDINITGDVVYKTEPVTTTQNQTNGPPPPTAVDTLMPNYQNMNQDLGIFTANGNIILSTPYADDNLEVDGSQAAVGASCASNSCGFLVNGCINTFNNVGGQIQTNIFGACMNIENTYYDRRYTARSNFAPPWFPATTIGTGSGNSQLPIVTPQRLSWVASSGQ
jgi:hypothetical protein